MQEKITTLIIVLIAFNISAQESEYPYPSLSPKGKIAQIVGNTMINIEYERPSVRKRKVFGGLVPWNEVWRTGAGSCTKISFDKPVRVGGQKIGAGKYSFFSIPNQEEWIIILNRDTTLYGSYDYDYKKDVARFITIPTQSSRFYETLNFDIEILPNDAKIYLSWADVQISFDVETTTDHEIEKLIEGELLSRKNENSDIYAGAAEYLFFKGDNLMEALSLTKTAIEINENNGWARSLKIKLYERLKLYDDALNEINIFLKYTKEKDYDNEAHRQNTINQLQADYERISKLMD